jgi:hypothetical protein
MRTTRIARPSGMTPAEFQDLLDRAARLKFTSEGSMFFELFSYSFHDDAAKIVLSEALFAFVPGLHSTDKDVCRLVGTIRSSIR